jgi:hypothetical protein
MNQRAEPPPLPGRPLWPWILLAALLLAAIPNDPFDGKPIRFRQLPISFVVYSIGANRVDDGGRERPQKGFVKDFDETVVIER